MSEGAAITATIKRTSSSIETLLEGYTAQAPEEERRLEVTEGGYNLGNLLVKLEEYLAHTGDIIAHNAILTSLTAILTPEQINIYLQMTQRFENHPEYTGETSTFINRLIQMSYNDGHNGFRLDLENLPALHGIGAEIKGTEEDPIAITVTGKTGVNYGEYAEHCTFYAQETRDGCGHGATNCTFNVSETAAAYGSNARNCTFNAKKSGKRCGHMAMNCTFNVSKTGDYYGQNAENCTFNTKKTGNKCGYAARKCTFHVKETADDCGNRAFDCMFNVEITGNGCAHRALSSTFIVQKTGPDYGYIGSMNTFKTADKRTLRKMLRTVPIGNRVILIGKNGKERIMREEHGLPR